MPEPIPTPFTVLNVLVMVEAAPLTDQYHQIELTQAQHGKLMDLLNTFTHTHHSDESFFVEVTDHEPVLIEGRRQYVDKK